MYEHKNKLFSVILLSLVFIDQLSKYIIRSSGGFYICNKGISFGLNIYPLIFWVFWLAIIITLCYYILKNKSSFGLSFILAGALSNILDRLYFGCVIDFVDLKFWPVFNLADSFIVIGVIILLLKTQFTKAQNPNKTQR